AMVHGPDGELTAGRKTRAVSTALRRALRARDGTRCAFPGCGCRGRDAHHVQSWAELGPTVLPNLVQLCRRHHTFVHEGGFRVEAMPGRRFRFLRPDGRGLAPAPALPVVAGDAGAILAKRWVPRSVTITRDTGYPAWDGEPVDYDWTLWCLAQSSAPPRAPDGPACERMRRVIGQKTPPRT
ncbi:MAG: HNH endonuclease, partial [Proteobacteria bacterium]|nr:HNH endonuclease [Pseudomonadota bacterium]